MFSCEHNSLCPRTKVSCPSMLASLTSFSFIDLGGSGTHGKLGLKGQQLTIQMLWSCLESGCCRLLGRDKIKYLTRFNVQIKSSIFLLLCQPPNTDNLQMLVTIEYEEVVLRSKNRFSKQIIMRKVLGKTLFECCLIYSK